MPHGKSGNGKERETAMLSRVYDLVAHGVLGDEIIRGYVGPL